MRIATGQTCTGISRTDFGNLTFRSGERVFRFDHGEAVHFDDAGGADGRPDWRAEIERDVVVRPAPDVAVRFLMIHDSHETGSGWRYYISGYRCAGGKLAEVFHREGLAVRIERLDSSGVVIAAESAPPAGTQRSYYRWDPRRMRYAIRPRRRI